MVVRRGTRTDKQKTTGIPSFDELLGGPDRGENVVWVGDAETTRIFEASFLAAGTGVPVVVGGPPPADVKHEYLPVAGKPDHLRQQILDTACSESDVRLVIRFDSIVESWGSEAAGDLFVWTCSRLFDLDAPASWLVSHANLTPALRRRILEVTQCVVEHDNGRLRVVKADGRPGIVGRTYELRTDGGGIELREMPAGGLGDTLRRIRRERGLTQADLAALAGISASAISQVEMGQRGMALDTAATLAHQLGVSVDDLLDRSGSAGHSLSRRSPTDSELSLLRLFDNPNEPLQAHALRLLGGHTGKPPAVVRAGEMVLVCEGVLQVDVGGASSALRAGDGILATTDRITGWRNLLDRTALGFWIAG